MSVSGAQADWATPWASRSGDRLLEAAGQAFTSGQNVVGVINAVIALGLAALAPAAFRHLKQ
ncbi:hypothetical protein ACBJ59_52565 [Nonomuraea sp. MTCD27]|uniref:hypothetical protein n=1 Tax=Nonomuraea sp. MTCD27 TaxID=1676747 RepID=UPI0035C18909